MVEDPEQLRNRHQNPRLAAAVRATLFAIELGPVLIADDGNGFVGVVGKVPARVYQALQRYPRPHAITRQHVPGFAAAEEYVEALLERSALDFARECVSRIVTHVGDGTRLYPSVGRSARDAARILEWSAPHITQGFVLTSSSLYAALIVAAGLACYGNGLSGPFVFDDRNAIVENSSIRSLETVLHQVPNSPVAGRPLVALSFAFNYRVGGLEARGYHLANIGIHVCTALLLFGVTRRTLRMPRLRDLYGARAAGLAFAIALLWTVHPLNTEAVDYVTERTESLMALMYMLTLYASIRALGDNGRARWQTAAVVACGLGMASKESMVTAPLLVMLYDRTFVFDDVPEAVRHRSRLYGGLVLTWLVLAYLIAPGPRSGSAGFSAGVGPWTYMVNQAVMIVRYLRLTFWPTSLVINYGPPMALTLAQVLPKAVAVGTLLMLTLVALVRWPTVGFLGAAVWLTLAPTSSIIPIATEVGAERRMYLPLMALVACTVLFAHRLVTVRRFASPALATAVLMVATGALATLTLARNREYSSALTLARTTLVRWPTEVAHGMVGTELAALGRDDEALPELRIAAAADPRARYNLGLTLFNRKDFEGAIRELETVAREYPLREEIPPARRAIGNAYALQRKWPEAILQYRRVLSMAPSDQVTERLLIDTLNNQGTALGRAGRFADAVTAFRQALGLDPSSAITRNNLATALYDSGDIAGALAEARLAIATNGGDAASYDLIARALALQGQYDEAVEQLQQALRLSPNNRDIQDDLRQVLAARSGSKRREPSRPVR
jgi:tetratricopeptide (TPR) repeat protein